MNRLYILTILIPSLAGCVASTDDIGATESAVIDGASVYHSVVNGGGASVTGGDQWGHYDLDVWEDSETVQLAYFVQSVDPTSEVCITESYPGRPPCPREDPECPCNIDPRAPECAPIPIEYTYCYYTRYTMQNGWGQIPTSDYHSSPNAARLSTTVEASPSFHVETCTFDRSTYGFECDQTGGGSIDMEWTSNGLYSYFHSGVDEYRYGKYISRRVGQRRFASSDASGVLFGDDVRGLGQTYSGRNVAVDVMPAGGAASPTM